MSLFTTTPSEHILKLLHEHKFEQESLMMAVRDMVDEYEAERYHRFYAWVALQNVSEGRKNAMDEIDRPGLFCPTGYVAIDHSLGGLRRGWLYMITGGCASGKTPLLYNLALEVGKRQSNRVMLYAMCADKVGVARRMYASITERHRDEVQNVNPEEIFSEDGLFYHPLAGAYKVDISTDNPRHLQTLFNTILFHCRERKIKYFFIDDPEQILSGAPPHVMAYRRRVMYEKLKELCVEQSICIIMARSADIHDVQGGEKSSSSVFRLEEKGYCLRDIDVVLHYGYRQEVEGYNPIRKLSILKYPRQAHLPFMYLHHRPGGDHIRNVSHADIEYDTAPKDIYYEDLLTGSGLTLEKPLDQWIAPPF